MKKIYNYFFGLERVKFNSALILALINSLCNFCAYAAMWNGPPELQALFLYYVWQNSAAETLDVQFSNWSTFDSYDLEDVRSSASPEKASLSYILYMVWLWPPIECTCLIKYLFMKCVQGFYSPYFISHNNPCFRCNTAITNFLVSNACEIRFHDVIDRACMFRSWSHPMQKFLNMVKWVCFGLFFFKFNSLDWVMW